MSEYKNVSGHSVDLDDGRIVGEEETVSLSSKDAENDHNKALIDDGILISTSGEEAKTTSSRKKSSTTEEEEGG